MARERLSALHIAVLRGDIYKVYYLVTIPKCNLDVTNAEGVTPLMLAALYGRENIVDLLLHRNASTQLKDKADKTAAEYAKAGRFAKTKLKAYRALGFRAHARSRDIRAKRLRIYQLLSEPSQNVQSLGAHNPRHIPVFYRDGTKLVLFQRVAELDTKVRLGDKTRGCLVSESGQPIMWAISGWRNKKSVPGLLPNANFVRLVFEVADHLLLEIPRSPFDGGGQVVRPAHHGRYNASHVEKQLAVYWLLLQMRHALGTEDLSRLRELKNANLPDSRRCAEVWLDHIPCASCRGFVNTINEAAGLQITTHPRPFVTRGLRCKREQRRRYCPKCPCKSCNHYLLHGAHQQYEDLGRDGQSSDLGSLYQGTVTDMVNLPAQKVEVDLTSVLGSENIGIPTGMTPKPARLAPSMTPPPISPPSHWRKFQHGIHKPRPGPPVLRDPTDRNLGMF
jgi:hypothetical protein